MANDRRSYIERDSRGRLISVRSSSHHRSSSHNRKSSRELLHEAEDREQVLIGEVSSLQTRLSYAQRSEWHLENLRREHQTLVNEHFQCREVHAILEGQLQQAKDMLTEEERKSERLDHKNDRLKEEIAQCKEENRLLKRTSGESYQAMYDEKAAEVELLRQRLATKENSLRLADARVDDRNRLLLEKERIISYLKTFLRREGFRVED